MTSSSRICSLVVASALISSLAGCSNGVVLGPSDAATPTATSGSTTTGTAPAPTPTPAPGTPTPTPTPAAVAYTDLAPTFASDCTPCHGGSRPAAGYSTSSYAGVMRAVKAGSASSALVIVTQPGGVMYGFLSGDRTGKAASIRTWVLNGAPQTR